MSRTIKTLVVNSRNRTSGTTTNFKYDFNDHFDFSNVKLARAVIPSTEYNIVNVVLDFNDGLSTIVNLPNGNYDITELCAEIQTQLQTFDPNYSCTYNAITMQVTIANTTPVNFELQFLNNDEIARRLGFEAVLYSGSASYSSPITPQLIETEYYITINEFGHLVDNGIFRSTFYVGISEIRGNFNIYTDHSQFHQSDHSELRTEKSLTVSLRDNNGDIVDLGNADWSMILLIN